MVASYSSQGVINLFLGFFTLAVPQVERATAPSFRGTGDGNLVILEVPENVPLEFFIVQCARAEEGRAVFDDIISRQ